MSGTGTARLCRAGVLAYLLFVPWPPSADAQETRTFVDAAGRSVAVPARIERVYAAGPPASVIVFSLAPDKLIGWTSRIRSAERPFLPPRYADLPNLGRLTGRGNTANVEVVLGAAPDVIIDYGTISPTYASLADRVQAQLGIPYVLIDGSFDGMETAYRLLGELLDERQRADELIRFVRDALADVDRAVAAVPTDRRRRVYYARGPDGLQTGLAGSINVESLERVGAINVAAEALGRGGLASVSLEQVLLWNPDTIITIDASFYRSVWSDPLWRNIDAVRNRRVSLAPTLPFGWIDFPPSVNRIVGLRWLLSVLYPDHAPDDLRDFVREFFTRFYHRTPSEAQLDELLQPPRTDTGP